MPLTDTVVRSSKPTTKSQRLFDGGGLYLEVAPSGGKWWRLKYRFAGKEKRLSLGTYPEVSLKQARERRDDARRLLNDGIDPSAHRKARQAAHEEMASNTLEAIGREWIARHLAKKSATHHSKVAGRIEREIFPYLGHLPARDIGAPEILRVLRRIEARNHLETAHRVMQHIGQIIRYAVSTGRADTDPTQALRGALPPATVRHMAAPTDPTKVAALLRMLDAFEGSPVVGAAIRLLPLLFVRPGELRTMRWEETDLEAREWRYTTSKTKTEHLVPLSNQAIAILEELHPLTGHLTGGWVFPGARSAKYPMSNMAINAAYRRLGIDTRNEITGHGWRACARTLLHEQLKYPPEVIEHQLAHAVPDALGRAYNRTRFIDERRKMMQAWADYLERIKVGAEIIRLPLRAELPPRSTG